MLETHVIEFILILISTRENFLKSVLHETSPVHCPTQHSYNQRLLEYDRRVLVSTRTWDFIMCILLCVVKVYHKDPLWVSQTNKLQQNLPSTTHNVRHGEEGTRLHLDTPTHSPCTHERGTRNPCRTTTVKGPSRKVM